MFEFKKEVIYPHDLKSLKRFEQYKEYYKVKYDICKNINPNIIAEIGVRAGYSAWSFLQAAPSATYYGFDANNGKHGGQGGETGAYSEWARHLLRDYDCTFVNLDTQTVGDLNIRNIDLFHVDGDHSITGVQHDLDLAFKAINNKGFILIDDITYIKEVKKGVDEWIEKMNNLIDYEFMPSLRGEMLIKRRQHESL